MFKKIMCSFFTFLFFGSIVIADDSWRGKMGALMSSVLEILPIVFDDGQMATKSGRIKADKLLKSLSKTSHKVNRQVMKKAGVPNLDPSLEILSRMFEDEVESARGDLKSGRYLFLRRRMKAVLNHCFSCHSSGKMGKTFADSLDKRASGLSPIVRAELLASTRRYDAAIEAYRDVLADRELYQKRRFDWGRSFYQALIMSVRIKKDPDLTSDFLNRAFSHRDQVFFFEKNKDQWMKSVSDWRSEGDKTPKTEEGFYAEGLRLMKRADTMKKYPADTSGAIEYLRATSHFHELLDRFPKGKKRAETFFLLGESYDSLGAFAAWEMPAYYYELCIRTEPHSKLAKKCFEQYEMHVYLGYSGSSGLNLPAPLKRNVDRLRKLSGLE